MNKEFYGFSGSISRAFRLVNVGSHDETGKVGCGKNLVFRWFSSNTNVRDGSPLLSDHKKGRNSR